MCHLALLLPVFGLAVFFVLPFPEAFAAYLVIAGLTVLLYKAIINAMGRPVATGREALLGAPAVVRRVDGRRILVSARGELWSARPVGFGGQAPRPGDQVIVREIRGSSVAVGPFSTGADPAHGPDVPDRGCHSS